MASKPKQKMPVQDRAKQFMPFSALKGLEEALREKEQQMEEKKVLSEERAEELTRKLSNIIKGDTVQVTYFKENAYVTVSGTITGLDTVYQTLTVEERVIAIPDLYDITKQES